MARRVVVIGGGISGLAAAYQIRRTAPQAEVLLIESGPTLGGVIGTHHQDGFMIEDAADNFMATSPVAIQLCRELGLGDDLIGTNPGQRGAMVVHHGRLQPIPEGFLVMAPSRLRPLATTKILSPLGKLRAAMEVLVPKKATTDDETLQSFVTRRFGRQLFDRLVQPLVGGIYTADPSRLSVAATMPRFMNMEQEHGSLIRAMLRQRKSEATQTESGSGARDSQFMTLRGGMSRLIDALAAQLPQDSILLNSPVCCVVPGKGNQLGKWTVLMKDQQPASIDADAVVMAAPANHAWGMLSTVDSQISAELKQIPYASCAVLSLAYRREQIGRDLNSFGFVVPLAEKRFILSCSFSSVKYDGRAPAGTVLLRVFIGGACQQELLELSDHQLIELAELELAKLLSINGLAMLRTVKRQLDAIPQYHLGHRERVARINDRLAMFPTLALAGSAFSGVGVPGCIESGTRAANRIVAAIHTDPLTCVA